MLNEAQKENVAQIVAVNILDDEIADSLVDRFASDAMDTADKLEVLEVAVASFRRILAESLGFQHLPKQ